MARGRFLSKKISLNLEIKKIYDTLGCDAVIVFTWMLAHLDRDGRMSAHPDIIKSQVVPLLSGVTTDLIQSLLGLSHDLGLISVYGVDEKEYLEFPKFKENQRGLNYEKEAASECPSNSGVTPDFVKSYSCKGRPEYKENRSIREEKLNKREVKFLCRAEKEKNELALVESQPLASKSEKNEKAQTVVDYYKERNPGRGKHLKPGHRDWKRVVALINDGFTVEDLKLAVDGNLIDKWHVENGNHSAEYVFRNATKVEKFIEVAKTGNKQSLGVFASATKELLDGWARDDNEKRICNVNDKTSVMLPERGCR